MVQLDSPENSNDQVKSPFGHCSHAYGTHTYLRCLARTQHHLNTALTTSRKQPRRIGVVVSLQVAVITSRGAVVIVVGIDDDDNTDFINASFALGSFNGSYKVRSHWLCALAY